jgi:hypothetical protein
MSLILDGTNGLSDVDGSAATPAIRGSDANTGVFFGTDIVGVSTGGTERMRVDASGNVGIGTSSPAEKLQVAGGIISTSDAVLSSGVSGTYVSFDATNLISNIYALTPGTAWRDLAIRSNETIFFGSGTERARIDSSGNLLVGTTVAPTTAFNAQSGANFRFGIQLTQLANANTWRQITWSSDSGDAALYFTGGTALNTVANTASLSGAGAWVNASDGRQKTNVQDLDYGLQTVMQAKPRRYNRIDTSGEFIGFVAQELLEVAPEVVHGSEATSYGVSYGELVAVAFKAIQEQQAIITALTARVEALEGAQA